MSAWQTESDEVVSFGPILPKKGTKLEIVSAESTQWTGKAGEVQWMGRTGLYGLETSLGFDPVYVNGSGQPVEPFIAKDGRKLAPKGEGIKRQLNPSFMSAFVTAEGHPNLAWAGK